MKIFNNYILTGKNSLKLEASCDHFIELSSKEDVLCLLSMDNFDLNHFYILGGGTNVVLPQNFKGMVLHPKFLGIEYEPSESNKQIVRVGAGEEWSTLITFTLDNKLYGLENLTLIPGSVGAAPIQNIGAYGVEVCE